MVHTCYITYIIIQRRGYRDDLLVEEFEGRFLGLQSFPAGRMSISIAITFIRENRMEHRVLANMNGSSLTRDYGRHKTYLPWSVVNAVCESENDKEW